MVLPIIIVPSSETQYSLALRMYTPVDHYKQTYKNNLKIMNLNRGVGINHCHKR